MATENTRVTQIQKGPDKRNDNKNEDVWQFCDNPDSFEYIDIVWLCWEVLCKIINNIYITIEIRVISNVVFDEIPSWQRHDRALYPIQHLK